MYTNKFIATIVHAYARLGVSVARQYWSKCNGEALCGLSAYACDRLGVEPRGRSPMEILAIVRRVIKNDHFRLGFSHGFDGNPKIGTPPAAPVSNHAATRLKAYAAGYKLGQEAYAELMQCASFRWN